MENNALLTDLYELKMAASYFEHKKDSLASFDLFIRNLPKNRDFFLAAGLHDVIDFLSDFHFDQASVSYLSGFKIFSKEFLSYLSTLKFTGSLWAIPEGTVFFPNEPILRIVAPLIEAQIVESALLNIINLQTTIATKAARIVLSSKGRGVYDFALRRTHGMEAALKVARSAYLAGFNGSSNVLAGKLYGIPLVGTMAHSFVMSFDDELKSFRAFVKTFPESATLLVDTYDTLKGVSNAVIIAKELEKEGRRLSAIRLDSGDLKTLSKKARALLDKNNLRYVKIFASGNLDEYAIKKLLSSPIDSFGVGTKMGVSADSPYSDVIYKLCEITNAQGEFLPTMKLSKAKVTYPGRKQIFRVTDKNGRPQKDILGLEGEHIKGEKLLTKVIDNGITVYNKPPLEEIRKFSLENMQKFSFKKAYPVLISPQLKNLTDQVSSHIQKRLKS